MSESDRLRTALANERTFLAYVRTALSAWIFGLGAIKFFPEQPSVILTGWLVIVAGTLILAWGLVTSRRRHKRIGSG